MAKYQVDITKPCLKEIANIPIKERLEVIKKIKELAEIPRPAGSKKLSGYSNTYRIRHGNYRVIYEINDADLLVIAFKAGHRKNIYS